MLDVHPSHAPTHTWKDFFIHIATIVVGLIIAVGLEQLVERVHQHYELRETPEALSHELEANRDHLVADQRGWLIAIARLRNNLLVLEYIRQHTGTPETALPGDLIWSASPFNFDHAAWNAAEKSGIVHLMPHLAWFMSRSSNQRREGASTRNTKSDQQSSNGVPACGERPAPKSECVRGQIPALTEPFRSTQGNHRNGSSPRAFVLPHDQVRLRIYRTWRSSIRGKVQRATVEMAFEKSRRTPSLLGTPSEFSRLVSGE